MNRGELGVLVASLPERSTTTDTVTADVVNFAFIGSREQFESAFSAPDGKLPTPMAM